MSYFSNLLTSTTSRYASFRRTLLSSSSEDDSSVDDPESSHVSRVLRAYYTEKNRPFPTWLGTDPRAAPQQPQQTFVGSAQGSLRSHNHSHSGSSAGNIGGGLSDLWADNSVPGRAMEEPGSLRRGFRPRLGTKGPEDPVQARQLPSQRAGSYQTQNPPYSAPLPSGARTTSPAPPSSTGSSVQERLKARLGGRSSPATPPSPAARDERRTGSSTASSGDWASASSRPYVAASSPWSGTDDGLYGGGGAQGQGYDGGGRGRDGAGYGRGPASGGQRPRG